MSIRNLLLSARFLHFLQRKRPSVKREALDVQSGIAYLLQSSTWKQRQHSTEPGCMTISYKEIYERFGRADGLDILTTRHNIFETTGDYSKRDGVSRAFKVVTDLAEGIAKYHRGWRYRAGVLLLLNNTGQELTAPLAAIDSLNMQGRHAKATGKTLVDNFVRVPVATMRKIDSALSRLEGRQAA